MAPLLAVILMAMDLVMLVFPSPSNPNNQYNWFIQYGLGSGAFGGQTAWHVGDASNW